MEFACQSSSIVIVKVREWHGRSRVATPESGFLPVAWTRLPCLAAPVQLDRLRYFYLYQALIKRILPCPCCWLVAPTHLWPSCLDSVREATQRQAVSGLRRGEALNQGSG